MLERFDPCHKHAIGTAYLREIYASVVFKQQGLCVLVNCVPYYSRL